MGIQSSINSLLSQAQSLAAFYKGFEKAGDIIKGQEIAKNEAKIQTDIASGNAPIKDGIVDPQWLQKRRDDVFKRAFNDDGTLTVYGESRARLLQNRKKRGDRFFEFNNEFYNTPAVQNYLKSQATNSELKNEVAGNLARASVESRTDSINKTKSNFDEHVASLIKYYSKGSGNP